MDDKKEKIIYYVSNLRKDMVSIIDGENYHIIKEIKTGPRPQNIIVDEKNNVYIASDRNSKVTLINDLYNCSKTWHIANNGNIQVDSIAQKIYVCNTEEVCIYSLTTGEKISSLKGFIAADTLKLDKDKKKLFVLDVLQNEIKVYDTLDFHLIRLYKDVSNSPKCIFVDENCEKIYIANKGNDTEHISILNIESGNIFHINLEIGSVITAFEGNGITLYAANSGLHRIEVIDTLKRKCIGVIKTTLPKIQRVRLSPDKKILIVISQSINGRGVIDKIDISRNSILDTFTFKKNNTLPCDIGVITQSKLQIKEKDTVFFGCIDKSKQENGTDILAKKIISTYQEQVIYPEVSIELSSECDGIIKIEEIKFKKCEIIKEMREKQVIDKGREYSILQCDFYIPYYIWYIDEQEQKYIAEGKIEGKEEAKLYIPSYAEQQEVQFVMNSFTKLKSTPALIGKNLQFDVYVLISIKAIIDEIIFIPFCKNCDVRQRNKIIMKNEEKPEL